MQHQGIISLPAIDHFVSARNFVVNTSADAKVKIYGLGKNFMKFYLEKAEPYGKPPTRLLVSTLLETSDDSEIIPELGGGELAEISLGQYFGAFAQQPNGEHGLLNVNSRFNVGYVRDWASILRPVIGHWHELGGGWIFGAVSNQSWIAGSRIISGSSRARTG